MARPQLEDGHTQIANEIVKALARHCPGHGDSQVLWAIIRKTYGWHKKEDSISTSQLMELTELSRRAVIYSIQNLEAKNMIIVNRSKEDGKNHINTIQFQKDYEQWIPEAKGKSYAKELKRKRDKYASGVVQRFENHAQKVVQRIDQVVQRNDSQAQGSATNGQKVVQRIENNIPIVAPTKETITKETTKDNKEINKESLPNWIKPETWSAFKEHRKKLRAPLTPRAVELIFIELEKLRTSGNDPEQVLNQSIVRGWRGVFPLKEQDGKRQTNSRQLPAKYETIEDFLIPEESPSSK